MSNRIAPNKQYWRWEYCGGDGVYYPIPSLDQARPNTMQIELTDQVVRGYTVGAIFTNQPIPSGSITVLDIQPTATTPTMYQHIVLGTNGFTGTNSTITSTVDVGMRLVSIKGTCNLRNIQGQSFYQIWTGVACMFEPSPSSQDSGDTWTVNMKVYGAMGDPVYL